MKRSGFAVLLLAVAALAISAAGAHAADKIYTVDMSPDTSEAGTAQTFTARFVNRGTNQSLGSANLTAPEGFAIKAAAVIGVGTVTTDGSTAFIRNLSLAPGRAVDVKLTVDDSTVSGDWTWSVAAKQANDFKGTGNDFTLDAARSDLGVTVNPSGQGATQDCPEETPGEPTATCRLTVTHQGVVDGAPYRVVASVVANPSQAGNAGTLSLALPSARNLGCPTLVPVSPVTALTNGPLGRAKTVRLTVDRAEALSAAPGICYAAPYPFATGGAGTPFLEGAQLFLVGTLLPCAPGGSLVTPCVAGASVVDGIAQYTVEIPALLPDPYIRG